MTVEDKWNIFAVFVEPEVRQIARAAYFAGYAEALAAAGDLEAAAKVMDQLREGKCG
jgi:hypothetical protein